jgi:hypothetical protein
MVVEKHSVKTAEGLRSAYIYEKEGTVLTVEGLMSVPIFVKRHTVGIVQE